MKKKNSNPEINWNFVSQREGVHNLRDTCPHINFLPYFGYDRRLLAWGMFGLKRLFTILNFQNRIYIEMNMADDASSELYTHVYLLSENPPSDLWWNTRCHWKSSTSQNRVQAIKDNLLRNSRRILLRIRIDHTNGCKTPRPRNRRFIRQTIRPTPCRINTRGATNQSGSDPLEIFHIIPASTNRTKIDVDSEARGNDRWGSSTGEVCWKEIENERTVDVGADGGGGVGWGG